MTENIDFILIQTSIATKLKLIFTILKKKISLFIIYWNYLFIVYYIIKFNFIIISIQDKINNNVFTINYIIFFYLIFYILFYLKINITSWIFYMSTPITYFCLFKNCSSTRYKTSFTTKVSHRIHHVIRMNFFWFICLNTCSTTPRTRYIIYKSIILNLLKFL